MFLTGFSRLSLPWFAPDEVIDFVLDAITFVADQGWKFMVDYDINTVTGEWNHISKMKSKYSFRLQKISYNKGFFEYRPQQSAGRNTLEPIKLEDTLSNAQHQLTKLTSKINEIYAPDLTGLFQGELARLRWTILPCEAKDLLKAQIYYQDKQIRRRNPPLDTPFKPKVYPIGPRMRSSPENIGSLHGGVSKVSDQSFLIQAQEVTSIKQNKFTKHASKVPGNQRKWTRLGLWSKEKLSKSKSIESLAAITKQEDNLPFAWTTTGSNSNRANDYENIPVNWNNKNLMEEKMISLLMREFLASNRDKILQQREMFGFKD